MRQPAKHTDKGVISIIEEAVHLLRLVPLKIILLYYVGSLPFILGLLFFISDMSLNAYAQYHCASMSFGLAVLFLWMKCWQSVFSLHLNARLTHSRPPIRTFRDCLYLVALQTIIQPTGFILLPVALLITLPLGWVYAFYQNILVLPLNIENDRDINTSIRQSIEQAKRWPIQNHLLLGVFLAFSLFVILNLGTAVYIIPHILKRFLGIETIFTLSGTSVLNTTFLAVLMGITYLCVDPLIKTVYVLRCFYGLSLSSGDDLKADLITQKRLSRAALMFITCVCVVAGAAGVNASETWSASASVVFSEETPVTPENLDKSIGQVLTKPAFTWRMPRQKSIQPVPEVSSPFTKAMQWVRDGIVKAFGFIKKILKKLFGGLLETDHSYDKQPSRVERMTTIQMLFFLLLCLTVCTLIIYLRRVWLNRTAPPIEATRQDNITTPDLSDETISADDFPQEKWLAMAKKLISQGALRLALRALYLATLAHLAELNMITIAHYKSNRDYKTELQRRAHEKTALLNIFADSVRLFDKAWYGLYEVTMDDIHYFSSNYQRLVTFGD